MGPEGTWYHTPTLSQPSLSHGVAANPALSLSAEITPELLPRPPRLLLLVNPFGGRGQAWQWCESHVLPMISEAGLSFNLIQTGMGRYMGLGAQPGLLGSGRWVLWGETAA